MSTVKPKKQPNCKHSRPLREQRKVSFFFLSYTVLFHGTVSARKAQPSSLDCWVSGLKFKQFGVFTPRPSVDPCDGHVYISLSVLPWRLQVNLPGFYFDFTCCYGDLWKKKKNLSKVLTDVSAAETFLWRVLRPIKAPLCCGELPGGTALYLWQWLCAVLLEPVPSQLIWS